MFLFDLIADYADRVAVVLGAVVMVAALVGFVVLCVRFPLA